MDQHKEPSGGLGALAGEPGVGVDLSLPFRARDAATSWLFGLNRKGIRPGLVRVQGLLKDLGNPQDHLRTLVVAGTNGKGSTTRILARLLRAKGFKIATYTSPHLLQVTERIQINEQPVDPGEFAARVDAIRPLVDKHQASWFETLTALAVQIARDEKVDFLCCETGLGGRLDATNALPAEAVLLTGIGLDHQHILGETVEAIAAEKLGLLKPGVPFFCGLRGELKNQAFTAAIKARAHCHFLDELTRWKESDPLHAGTWELTLRDRIFTDLPDGGRPFSRRNTALALLTLTELGLIHQENLIPGDLARALGNLFLPGRYQLILRDPDWILDTAHNVQALTATLKRFVEMPVKGRRVLLMGGMQDKTWGDEVDALIHQADEVVLTPVSLPRSRTCADLQTLVADWKSAGIEGDWIVAADLPWAIKDLAGRLNPDDAVLATGSCFLVAETLHLLGFGDLEATRNIQAAGPVLADVRSRTAGRAGGLNT